MEKTGVTPFKRALEACGLSQREAAEFLAVRLDTLKSWCSGRREPPPGAWDQLRDLYSAMSSCAIEAAELADDSDAGAIQWRPGARVADWPSESVAQMVFTMAALMSGKTIINRVEADAAVDR